MKPSDGGRNVVYVFGNPDLEEDSLPVRLTPLLRARFPEVDFEVMDPNEEWDVPRELVVLDTLVGAKDVAVFNDLESFAASPRFTVHDFDALTNLRLLQKLGRLQKVTVIGIPQDTTVEQALASVSSVLAGLFTPYHAESPAREGGDGCQGGRGA